jgi:hypothetical protein
MGSMIHLAVGRLEIDWGKNNGFRDHSALFQGECDVANVPYYYASDEQDEESPIIIEFKEGLSKPLNFVIDRINLLGHTYKQCEREFYFLSNFNGFDDNIFRFDNLRNSLKNVDVNSISAGYGEGNEDFGKFFRRELAPRLRLEHLLLDRTLALSDVSEAMENLSAYSILHLLSQNPHAASLPVQWAFNDIDEGGYARRDDFVRSLDPRVRFLIVTEGSSDAAILRHALKLLRPHIADFFDFVDMQEGYPFSGTGNLFRFVQGLISISVQNKILVLFDNDAEGIANHKRCSALNIPPNMRILSLPDLPELKFFQTVGPDGENVSDINGRAAAIECYLDLDRTARVRWTTYNHALGAYHGELEGKTRHMRTFLDQRQRRTDYNYSRLEKVLDALVEKAVSISEQEVSSQWEES